MDYLKKSLSNKEYNEEDYNNRMPAIKENMELAKNYISTYDWMYNNINFEELIK